MFRRQRARLPWKPEGAGIAPRLSLSVRCRGVCGAVTVHDMVRSAYAVELQCRGCKHIRRLSRAAA